MERSGNKVFRVVEDGNRMRGRTGEGENEKESGHTYSSVGKSEHTYSYGFLHIVSIFLFFRKSPLKGSIFPERHLKAISVFYEVGGNGIGGHVFFHLEIGGVIFLCFT